MGRLEFPQPNQNPSLTPTLKPLNSPFKLWSPAKWPDFPSRMRRLRYTLTNHVEEGVEEGRAMFVCCLTLINRRVNENHVPQDEHATRHTAPRLLIHLCTEVRRAGRRGEEQRGVKGTGHSVHWDPRCSQVQSSRTCDGLTVDAPGDGWCGDAFGLTVQADSFPRRVQLTDWLLHPVGGRCDQNATLFSYGYGPACSD